MVNVNDTAELTGPDAPARTLGAALHTVIALALIVALLGLGLAHGLRAWFDATTAERADPALAVTHSISIGAQRYGVPAGLLPDPTQRRDGFSERMDMTLALPLLPDGLLSEVEIAVMPRGRLRTSAALLDSVYLHQFSEAQVSGPPGLVGKPLERDAGTSGETVWYDPLSANPFAAKCMAPVDMRPGARTCLRVMTLLDRNTAIVSFDPAVLPNWRNFDAVIEEAMAALRQ